MGTRLEPAVPVGVDPRKYARDLARVRETVLGGAPVEPGRGWPVRPRAIIEQSWRRNIGRGVNPDTPSGTFLKPDELEERRRTSRLAEVLPMLSRGLLDIADEASHIMLVVDADGTVLWRDGSNRVKTLADRVAIAEGAAWSEEVVGTNGVGTGLALGRPVQVFSAEHYASWLQGWTCSSAPIHDPRSGELVGVIDISGPAATVHASTLGLVDAVARLARSQLETVHKADLERLRTAGVPILSRTTGPAMITDEHGWVAATSGLTAADRVPLPEGCAAGEIWLPTLGRCEAAPLPGGWLLSPRGEDETGAAMQAELDLNHPRRPTLRLVGAGGSWTHRLSPRHAEVLLLLAYQREGRSAAQLATDLFGDVGRTVTVRAELSRMRRRLGRVLANQPYRYADGVQVSALLPALPEQLLPMSTAPAVQRLRQLPSPLPAPPGP